MQLTERSIDMNATPQQEQIVAQHLLLVAKLKNVLSESQTVLEGLCSTGDSIKPFKVLS